ncbi:MAG: lipid-A-disaccharide synthase [Gammaproteobacteria bacterium]|nr:lipid-A-disaccharide synthase [Gammaproteobacteria bacterium]
MSARSPVPALGRVYGPKVIDHPEKPLRIAIVAGEPSGDLLGAGLLRAIVRQWEQRSPGRQSRIQIEGIGGPEMIAAGCHSLASMERLSVAGLSEVLARVPELLLLRARLAKRFCGHPPDVFIGIDAPDFNLSLEKKLRQSGIPVVHYVSPTVWAWRGYRIKKIARAVDLMLTLFPFEEEIYTKNRMQAQFVGHPLADAITDAPDKEKARRALGLPSGGKIVALLPGSRLNEVKSMAPLMLRTARWLTERQPGIRFVVPLINTVTRDYFQKARAQEGRTKEGREIAITVLDKQARTAMAAADAVLVTVGTATLETLLMQRPMVITLRVSPLTYHIGKSLATVDSIGLPNLLAGRPLVPELLQKDATPEKLGEAVLALLENPQAWTKMQTEFRKIGETLRKGADESSAAAVLRLLDNIDYAKTKAR